MAGRAGRTYKRDGNGRFASTGTSGKKSRPPAKSVSKGVNKLTRDNAGKITSVGGDGATARGGRLKTAAGNLRATQTKRLKTMQGVSYGKPAATVAPPSGRRKKGPRTERLARILERGRAIAGKRKVAADAAGEEFANRRRITKGAGRKGWSSAMNKEEAASVKSAKAMRSWMRADKRNDGLVDSLRSRRIALEKAAPKAKAQKKLALSRSPAGTIAKRKGGKVATKPNPLAGASARLKSQLATAGKESERAAARAQYKSAVIRAMRADRSSVVPPIPAKPKRAKLQRPAGTMAKTRTVGNSKAVVAGRVNRKIAVNKALMKHITRYGNAVNQGQYERQLNRGRTLERARNYLATGKLPGKDNSMAKQREMSSAKAQLKRTNAARARAARAGANATPKMVGKGGKVDLSQLAFESRAKRTERRARAAEKAVDGADRGYASPSTRRLFRTADALRSAADSYSSYARRGQKGEFSAGYLFTAEKKSSKRTTAPKLTRTEKAARTRATNAEKKFQEQRRRMEESRRYS